VYLQPFVGFYLYFPSISISIFILIHTHIYIEVYFHGPTDHQKLLLDESVILFVVIVVAAFD